MSRVIDAIFEDGFFKPVSPVRLPDRQRVRLTIEDELAPVDAGQAIARRRLIEGFSAMALRSGGYLPSRDQLHERD